MDSVTVTMERSLAVSLHGYVAGHGSITADQAFDVAASLAHALGIDAAKPDDDAQETLNLEEQPE
jgi:hypothetical protein